MRHSPKGHVPMGAYVFPVWPSVLHWNPAKVPQRKTRYTFRFLQISLIGPWKALILSLSSSRVPSSLASSVLGPFPHLAGAPRNKNGHWYPLTWERKGKLYTFWDLNPLELSVLTILLCFFFLSFLATPHGLWNFSSLTRDRTQVLSNESAES